MLGAIIGDTVGSRFEWHNVKRKDFEFLTRKCHLTDDSVMTIAIAQAILDWDSEGYREKKDYAKLSEYAAKSMRKWGMKYPYAGYGGGFRRWLADPSMGPYNSCGNGSAMRVSPVGFAANNLEECIAMSRAVTEVTHNHPDGIMGAEATSVQIFLARQGASLKELQDYEVLHYYTLDHDLAWLIENYTWHSLCDGTCQAAYTCLYESTGFEDAIRNCMAAGGDCDTTGAICGGIAQAFWGIPEDIRTMIMVFMDREQKEVLKEFENRYMQK